MLVLVFHLILLLSCKYFACFICFFFQFAVLVSLSFVVILSSLCIYLMFVLQYHFSLFQIACHRFVSVVERLDSIKLFVRKIKACKGRDFTSLLKPFAYSAWILYYHQYMWFLAPDAIIIVFATVWAVVCVRRDPETFSRDLRIVTRSVHDFKKIVIYSEHRQKQIKFRYRIQLKLDVSFRFPLLLLHVLSALYSFSHWIWNIGNHCTQIFEILVQVF